MNELHELIERNYEIDSKNMEIKIFISTKIYPLQAVFMTANAFLDKFYINIDGSPDEELIVVLEPKERENKTKKDLKEYAKEFINELINFSVIVFLQRENRPVREALIKGFVSYLKGGENEKRNER